MIRNAYLKYLINLFLLKYARVIYKYFFWL